LQRCDEVTISAVQAAVAKVSRPFIAREVERAIASEKQLVYDGDLTGRPVGHSSTTYPGAAYGWMGDGVHFGYQAAMVSMHSPTYGRSWLSVEHHPGDVVSASQAEAMVHAAEASTGVRPWRRTDLLERRINDLAKQLAQAEEKSVCVQKQFDEATRRLAETKQTHQLWSDQVEKLTAYYQEKKRPERPYSHLAKARRKLTTWVGRLQRRRQELGRTEQRLLRTQTTVETLRSQQGRLQQRLRKFIQDNETNPMPVRAIFRLDGGFGCGDNLTLLIEMGYIVYTKATNPKQLQAFRRRITSSTEWTRVGKNAEMVAWREQTIGRCPYPVNVALERFYTGATVQHGLLVHFGEEAVTTDLQNWFHFYNQRQTIEAGIKEGKQVFQMHHLKVRSPAGLVIQELFAAFAANFVRWAAAWLHETCVDLPTSLSALRPNVKRLVRVAANTSAWVSLHSAGCLLRFTELSAFAGIQLLIGRSAPCQLALPFIESVDLSPI
jgi:hypothetical protein